MDQTQVFRGLALAMQLGTALYALRLNRLFGTDRAGWSLFGAFALMVGVHLNEAWLSWINTPVQDTTNQLAYLVSSALLLIGLVHVGIIFQERIRIEHVIRASRDELDDRVRERTVELAQANTLLQAEVSERRRAEAASTTAQIRYRDLVNSLDCVVFEAEGPDLHFTFVSPQCESMLGYAPDQLLGRLVWRDFVHPDDVSTVFDSCGRNVAAQTKSTLEFRALAKDGREVWLRQMSTVVTEADGTVKLRGVLVDLTTRRLMEAQLAEAQKLESVSRLAGGVAHDFNNILTVIQGHSACLLSLDHLPSSIMESLQAIQTASERAAQVTAQLLTFGQGKTPELKFADLNRVIAGAMQKLRSVLEERVTLASQLSPEPIGVLVDAELIELALTNIAWNAQDAMPAGGELKVQTRVVTLSDDYTAEGQQWHPGEYACLTVADTGCGIESADLPRIFEPFFTTKQVGKGSGLGLATVYGIVRQHHGWIEVLSSPGEGASFSIFLPVCAESPPAPAPRIKPA